MSQNELITVCFSGISKDELLAKLTKYDIMNVDKNNKNILEPGYRIVYLGDLSCLNHDDTELIDFLLKIQQEYPENVILVAGKGDIFKLNLSVELSDYIIKSSRNSYAFENNDTKGYLNIDDTFKINRLNNIYKTIMSNIDFNENDSTYERLSKILTMICGNKNALINRANYLNTTNENKIVQSYLDQNEKLKKYLSIAKLYYEYNGVIYSDFTDVNIWFSKNEDLYKSNNQSPILKSSKKDKTKNIHLKTSLKLKNKINELNILNGKNERLLEINNNSNFIDNFQSIIDNIKLFMSNNLSQEEYLEKSNIFIPLLINSNIYNELIEIVEDCIQYSIYDNINTYVCSGLTNKYYVRREYNDKNVVYIRIDDSDIIESVIFVNNNKGDSLLIDWISNDEEENHPQIFDLKSYEKTNKFDEVWIMEFEKNNRYYYSSFSYAGKLTFDITKEKIKHEFAVNTTLSKDRLNQLSPGKKIKNNFYEETSPITVVTNSKRDFTKSPTNSPKRNKPYYDDEDVMEISSDELIN